MTDPVCGYYAGLDGGASKTAAALADTRGRLLARVRTTGCSIVGVPAAAATGVMRAVFRDLCAQAGVPPDGVRAVAFGLNGVDFADEFSAQTAGVAAALGVPAERLVLVNDAIPALWGAADAPAAAVIQFGSGFTAAWRARPGAETLFDHLSVGAPYDPRTALPAAVARMLDGRLPETPLLTAALRHYGISERAAFAAAYYRRRIPQERCRSVLPLICAAWESGDPLAADIVAHTVEECAVTGLAMLARTGAAEAVLAIGGGLFRHAPGRLIAAIAARVAQRRPGAAVIRPYLPPELGAVLLAAHHAGGHAPSLFGILREQEPDQEQCRYRQPCRRLP
jgi:N-acetylglucosamine kinase-like BadF-type ATPase